MADLEGHAAPRMNRMVQGDYLYLPPTDVKMVVVALHSWCQKKRDRLVLCQGLAQVDLQIG